MAEKNLDFDEIINRRNTGCLKYDFAERRGYPADVLPLWVADMDFRTSSYVEEALSSLSRFNLYGYINTQPGDGFLEAVGGWMKRHHRWDVQPEWLVKTPGVCFAISMAIRAFTRPGDAVLVQQPVYYPFSSLVRANGRKLVSSDLRQETDGRYVTDFEDFEQKIVENNVRLFILCNPHNPVGRSWTAKELLRIGRICRDHGVIVFSDEIHFDLVWTEEHQVFQTLDPTFPEFTLTATSSSKTFNLAGLQQSNIFVPNELLRKSFLCEIGMTGYDEPNIFGIAATKAAYTHGDEWYKAMKEYVSSNIRFASRFIRERLPGVTVREPEATYLMWLDFRGTGLPPAELEDLVVRRAGLWLDRGEMFGKSGSGFERINAACPRATLTAALERLEKALAH